MPKSLSVLLVISIIGKFLFLMLSIESVKTSFSLPISEAWKDYVYAYIPTVQAFIIVRNFPPSEIILSEAKRSLFSKMKRSCEFYVKKNMS